MATRLTAAFTRTNTDLRALGETMKYAGPVAGKLGISLEQAAAMAGVLANMGIRGSDAGTAMRASPARLASPPKAAAEALKELGVSVSDANGKMRPMEDVLADLYKATRKYGGKLTGYRSLRTLPEKRLSHRLWRSLMRR